MSKGSGPGYTRQNPRPGGPGAKTGADGRMSSSTKKKSGLSNQDKLMIGTGVAALGAAVLKGRGGNKKAIGPGPIGRAQMDAAKAKADARKKAGITSRGRYAAPGKPVKSPLARTSPGKHAAPNNTLKKVGKIVGKSAKFAGLNTPAGRIITGSLIASSFIKPLDVKGNNKRKPPMGNPPKKTTKK
jgi:hypothetical protein